MTVWLINLAKLVGFFASITFTISLSTKRMWRVTRLFASFSHPSFQWSRPVHHWFTSTPVFLTLGKVAVSCQPLILSDLKGVSQDLNSDYKSVFTWDKWNFNGEQTQAITLLLERMQPTPTHSVMDRLCILARVQLMDSWWAESVSIKCERRLEPQRSRNQSRVNSLTSTPELKTNTNGPHKILVSTMLSISDARKLHWLRYRR